METNPYQAPTTELSPDNSPSKRSGLWKLYFWFICSAQLAYLVWVIIDPKSADLGPSNYFDLIIYIPVLLALFGFVYSKRFFSQKFWQFFLPIIALWDMWFVFIDGEWGDTIRMGYPTLILVLVITLAVLIPQYIGLFLYGFREENLWKSQH